MSDSTTSQDAPGVNAGTPTTTAAVAASPTISAAVGSNQTHSTTTVPTTPTVSVNTAVTANPGTPVNVTFSSAQQVTMVPIGSLSQAIPSSTGLVTVTPTMAQVPTTSPQVSHMQTVHTPAAGTVMRSSLPQGTVQVIQAPHPFMQQQIMQQQYYIQSVQGAKTPTYISAVQAQPMAQQVNLTAVQARSTGVGTHGKTPASGSAVQKSSMIAVTQAGSHHTTVTLRTVAPTFTTVAGTHTAKGGKTLMPQQAMFGGKQVLRGAGGQPLVIGQLGVLSSAGNQQTLVAQAQPKSPSVTIAPGGQIINSPTQIRFTNPPTFVTSQGQILGGNVTPAMLNQLQMATIQPNTLPLGSQQVQSAIIGTQPLYLRPAGTLQTQQGIVGRVQAVLPSKGLRQNTDTGTVQMKSTGTQVKTVTPAQVKGVANILPQTARPAGHLVANSTMAKGVQTAQITGKQISRVRALKQQVKGTIAQVIPGTTRIAPQVTAARFLTPAVTRPPTLLVQPKPQPLPQKVITTTVAEIVTAPPMTTVATTTVATTQAPVVTKTQTTTITEAPVPCPAASPEKTLPVPIPKVSPIKTEPVPPTTTADETKTEEPMEVELVAVTGPGVIGTGAPGVVGAGAGPVRLASKENEHPSSACPSKPARNTDRPERIATVIGERQTAAVKPNVLTHIIEGFVIQEAPEPFPVQRCSALSDFIASRSSEQENDSTVDKDLSDSSEFSVESDVKPMIEQDENVKLKCEFCGKVDHAKKFRRSGRFCSRTCAKRYNVCCSRRIGLCKSRNRPSMRAPGTGNRKHKAAPMVSSLTRDNIQAHTSSNMDLDSADIDTDHGIGMSGLGAPSTMSMETMTTTSSESERSTSPSGQDESSSPRSPPELEPEMDLDMGPCTPRRPLSKWTVQEVVDFVRNLPGCDMYADEFNRQEIDGQALMLLKEDHLMTAMSIKLGPALKICNKIQSLREEGL